MFNIFAALRIALQPGAELGEIAIGIITEDFIPLTEDLLKREGNEGDKAELEELLGLWKHYADKKEADSKLWRNIANKSLQYGAMKFPIFKNELAEVESRIVEGFITGGRYRRSIESFNIKGGPKAFAAYWKSILHNEVLNAFRNIMKSSPEWGIGYRSDNTTNDEGGETNVLERIQAPRSTTNLDDQLMKDLKEDLDTYIENRFGDNDVTMQVYEAWMDAAEKKGADEVNFRQDVEIPLQPKLEKLGLPSGRSLINLRWRDLVKAIVDFFEKEEKIHLSPKLKQHLKVAEFLAYEAFRQRLASYVLELR
jgi:hypothetical protein